MFRLDYLTHNDLWWYSATCPNRVFQRWVLTMPLDLDFDWADGPLDAPVS